MDNLRNVLIVGASVAGVGAANELRREGFEGRITLVDADPDEPYDRPPLSKAYLSQDEPPVVHFHMADHWSARNIDLRLGLRAVALDCANRIVGFHDGTEIGTDAIILCTGARARRFPDHLTTAPIWTIRDLQDARGLRGALSAARHVAVIGGGFIGAEVASSARHLGLEVTVVELAELPFARILGPAVAQRVLELHQNAGVRFRLGVGVERVEATAQGTRMMLTDGSVLDADVVVAGLGSLPNVEWLEGSGLTLRNGVACDVAGRTSAPGIWAAGDMASWINPARGEPERLEHWTSAREQARIIAHTLLGRPTEPWASHVSYFWSDMHGARLQMLGEMRDADTVELVWENPEKRAFLAEYRKAGDLIAVAGVNAAVRLMRYQPQLAAVAA